MIRFQGSLVQPCYFKTLVEPSDQQYLIINALEILGFLYYYLYDQDTGIWYIETSSSNLPKAAITQTGEVYPLELIQDYDEN